MPNLWSNRRAARAARIERRIRRLADSARVDGRHKDADFLGRCADATRRGRGE